MGLRLPGLVKNSHQLVIVAGKQLNLHGLNQIKAGVGLLIKDMQLTISELYIQEQR